MVMLSPTYQLYANQILVGNRTNDYRFLIRCYLILKLKVVT